VPPDLSIVIPSHDRVDLLNACLASVARYAPPQTDIVVVDDGSAGGRVRAVAESYPRVGVVSLARRQGFCVAANAGVSAARGEVVELLNDDTIVTAGWVTGPLERFRNPSVAAVAPLVLAWPDGSQVDSAGDRYYLPGVAGKRGHGETLGVGHLQPGRVFGASACSAFYRREAFWRVGGFPESFGAYFEDVDLSFRLNRAGYQIVFEPRSHVLHRGSASYGRLPPRRLLEQQSHNEELVFWRNLPPWTLVRALPRHLAVLAGKAWRNWQRGTLNSFLWGRLRILGDIPGLLRHRRHLRQLGPDLPVEKWGVENVYW
jgi:GT2 family glycosyltransferase